VFVHGGALISGSPYKHNSYNWITTIAHFSDYDTLLLPIYSLAPEIPAPHALLDILCVLLQHSYDCDQRGRPLHRLALVGFSAGCFLLLQTFLVLHRWVYGSGSDADPDSMLFGVSLNMVRKLMPDHGRSSESGALGESFTAPERLARLLDSLTSIQLCSGLYRTDNLYLNERIDVSAVLREFIYVYTTDPARDDPLLALTKYLRRYGALCNQPIIRLYDVDVNSLSNHSVQLHAVLRSNKNSRLRRPNASENPDDEVCQNNGRGSNFSPTCSLPSSSSARNHLHIFDSSFFVVDAWLIKHGNFSQHKFTRNLQTLRSERGKIINAIHYHFFPFIACTDAAKITMKTIIRDLCGAAR
jgi:hypothetical protein